ncbi:MAG: hypothetical protein FWH40_06370 [Coriobacteriia bacterium]|nr:hypothetical protein [Coriobacteriia bacterium]MCL2137127.1 hypothetical protein [Coriobacteriia bacterium]
MAEQRLTDRENYLRMMNHEIPEFIPSTMVFGCGVGVPGLMSFPGPGVLEYEDMFGVPMVVEPNSGPIPKPGHFILEDVTKWRDIIKRPKRIDDIDWEIASKEVLDQRDPELLKVGGASVGNGYFMMLTYFMGFDNALVACMEEPDEVKDLLNFILELNLELGKKYIYYFKPDMFHMGDDIAHERAPFVSDELFLDIFEPMWRQHVQLFKEAGLPAEHHNCGAFAPFVKYIVDMGFDAWNPAQPTFNDLPAIKAEFGRQLAICGGFESNGFCALPETTEEEVRAEVRRVCDELAPGGGFAFGAFILGAIDNPESVKRNGWIQDEFAKIKFNYYN